MQAGTTVSLIRKAFGPWPVRAAKVNGGVCLFQAEIEQSKARRQVDRDPGIVSQEAGEAGSQSADAEGWQDREVESSTHWVRAEAQRSAVDASESFPDFPGIRLASQGKTDGLMLPEKKIRTKQLFQCADLPADCSLSQVQLFGRHRDALMAGSCLEGAKE